MGVRIARAGTRAGQAPLGCRPVGHEGDERPVARARAGLVAAIAVALLGALGGCSGDDEAAGDATDAAVATTWPSVGGDLANTRASDDATIAADDAADLAPAWQLDGIKGVTGTPIVDDGTVYVGDWTGHVRALDAATGDERWAHDLDSGYVGGSVAVDDDHVFVGTFDARIVALDRATGDPSWSTDVAEYPKSVVFGSPVVSDGLVVAGVGSFEVFVPSDPADVPGHGRGARRRQRRARMAVPRDRRGRRRGRRCVGVVVARRRRGARRPLHRDRAGVRTAGAGPQRQPGRARRPHGRGGLAPPVHGRRRVVGRPAERARRRRGGHAQPVHGRRHRRGGRRRQGRHVPGARPRHRRGAVGDPAHARRVAGWRHGLGRRGRRHDLRGVERRQPGRRPGRPRGRHR